MWTERRVAANPRTKPIDLGCVKGKDSPYRITERRVPELIPVPGSQPAGNVSHKPGGKLPLLSAKPVVTLATIKRGGCYQFRCLMGVNSLPKTVTRQRRGCDLNPGHSASESCTLTTRLPSHPGCESAENWQLPSTSTVAIVIITQSILPVHGRWNSEST